MFPVVGPRAGEVARRYERLDAAGLCIYCLKEPRLVGLKICAGCRARKKALRASKISGGQCGYAGCNRSPEPGKSKCRLHLEKARQWRAEKIARGECTQCPELRLLGRTKCQRHIDQHNATSHRAEQNPESKVSKLIRAAAYRSRKQGIPFALTIDDLLPLPTVCPVLGFELVFAHRTRAGRRDGPSLDRLIPALGYVRGNVRIISMRANHIRNDATASELEAVAKYARQIEVEAELTRRLESPR